MSFVDDEYKMVLVVRNDLKMGKGKMAAQVCFNQFSMVSTPSPSSRDVNPPCSVLMLLSVAINI